MKHHMHSQIKPGCDQCREKFETATSVCPFCWAKVSNKVFLGKNSRHIDGSCRTRQVLKIPDRTVDKPLPYPYPDGWRNPLPDKAFKPIKHKFFVDAEAT